MQKKWNLSLSVLVLLTLAQRLLPECLAGPMKDAAANLPGDVMAAFFVGDLKQADSDYLTVIDAMGLKNNVPESQRHPLKLLKEKLPGLTGFDETGSIAVIILKSTSLPEIMSNVVVLLPASDSARLLDDLGGDPVKPDDDKVRSVLLFGQTMYAAATPRHVAVAKTAEVARRASQQKTSIRDRLTSHEVDSLNDTDAAIWLDMSAIITIFKPQIDGLVGWALMMQMGSGEVGEEEARASKKQVDTVLEGLTSLLIGTALSEQGIGLRLTVSTKPGSDFAKQTQYAAATAPLLRGLPRRNYMAAFGQELHPAALQAALAGGLDPLFAPLRKVEGVDKDKVAAVQKSATQALEMLRAVRGSIDHVQAGPDGMIAASLIFETSDSAGWLELARKAAADIAALTSTSPADDEETEEPLFQWKPDAGEIEGAKVSQLLIDVLNDEELEEDVLEGLECLLGQGGTSVRLAAADAKSVAITIGGGDEQMARLIRAIRKNQSPMDDDAGVVLTAKSLAKDRAGVAYLAFDRIVRFLNDVAYECDMDEPFPFWMSRVDAPLAISVTGGDGWSRNDFFAPMPLLAGIVDGVRTMESYDATDDEDATEEDGSTEDPEIDDSADDDSDDE